jgi:hypothetical protein
MHMILHQAVRQTSPLVFPDDASEHREIAPSIRIVEVDRLSAVTACKDVKDSVLNLLSRPARHAREAFGEGDFTPAKLSTLKGV